MAICGHVRTGAESSPHMPEHMPGSATRGSRPWTTLVGELEEAIHTKLPSALIHSGHDRLRAIVPRLAPDRPDRPEQLRSELEDDTIRVVTIMPGVIATNFARNFDPAVVQGIIAATGLEVEVKPGEKLPDEVFDKLQALLQQTVGSPEDVASAVLYAVSQPIHVNVAELVVRPPKRLNFELD